MLHLRIVAEPALTDAVASLLEADDATTNIIVLPGAARQPVGDLVQCDVAREDASVVFADLRALGVTERGSISVERIELTDSPAARQAVIDAPGEEADAVVWESVQARTAEDATLSWTYGALMALAATIAVCGLLTDSPILVVGAMVVSPDFGPLAGVCVGATTRRYDLARAAIRALLIGLVIAVLTAAAVAEGVVLSGLTPDDFRFDRGLSSIIASPDAFTVIVALAAGAAGMLSMLVARAGALVGVLISVTTIPASAQVGLASALREWDVVLGAAVQLASNVAMVLLAGTATLAVQRAAYARRRRRHEAQRRRTGDRDTTFSADGAVRWVDPAGEGREIAPSADR